MTGYVSIYSAVLGVAFVYLASQALAHRERTKFCLKNGCKPAPSVHQKWYLFGLDNVVKFTTRSKKHVFLEGMINDFKAVGSSTVSTNMGDVDLLLTMSPENAKAILASKADDFHVSARRIQAFAPFFGDGVAASNGATWAHGRAILRPSFSKAQVSNSEVYERHFQELVAIVPNDGSTVDLRVLFSRLTLDVATEITFGESIFSQKSDAPQPTRDFDAAFDIASKGVMDRINLGPVMFLHRDPKFKHAVRVLHEYSNKIIDKALQEKESSKGGVRHIESLGNRLVFLDELVKDTSDKKRIRDLLLNALFAGRDTTMALLSHVFLHLSRHPEALKKLQNEISQLGGVAPTYEQFKDLKYLRWTIDETLRLTPSSPYWDREAKRDTVLPNGGGSDGKSALFMRKGQAIAYIFYGLCHSKEEWGDDVENFRPERWDGLKYTWHFTPFGGGERICPGQQLALNQASYIIVRMLQTFNGLESRDDRPWQEYLGATLSPNHGCKVSLTR